MVGHCEDMPAAYALSDVVMVPSTRPEAFGRIAVEAGAMGKTAIAADHGGARETIIDGETGFLVEPGSVDALAAAMVKTAELGAGQRRAVGSRARSRIAAQFSTRAMTDATLAAYRELLSRRAMRRETPQ
jgi:glycosyltransferase involved in cell wall biosynthesis